MLPFTFCRTVRVGCPVFIWRHTMKEEKNQSPCAPANGAAKGDRTGQHP